MPSPFRRILVPHDFSEHATRALKLAADLASQPKGKLRVLHAIPPFYPVTDLAPAELTAWVPPPDLIASEKERLEKLVAKVVKGQDAPTVDCQVVIGDPYQRIMDAADGMDAIVMSTHGRTGLAHLLIGSVAEKVVRHSPIPVLTLRPVGKPERRR
jgi:nucleotide-binding universal stress UspA family protein